MTMEQEQRKEPRIQPFLAPCHVLYRERRIAGYLTDLALAGARISCDEEPPPQGSPVILEVKLGRGVTRTRLAAEVKWLGGSDAPRQFGVTFTGVSEGEKRALADVIDGFRNRAAEL
jgi:hypothetical protein